ncbi:zinc knuckle CX2CX4HX4C containing protein, partial [Tanacetum coccineum]
IEKEDSVMDTTSLVDNFDQFITQLNYDGHATTSSFAAMLRNKTTKKIMKVTELRNDERVEGAAVAIPLEAVKEISSCFDNTLYGYFMSKRLAFPLVENYVKNTWHKFSLERDIHKNGFFFFQFTTRFGMERVLENGPWLIHSVPLILNIWTPNAKVAKEEVSIVPVWVKLHHVPIVAYSKIGTYARALIKVSATSELLNSVVVAIPFLDDIGHSLEIVDVEYEWTPSRERVTLNANVTNDDSTKPPTPKKLTPKEVVLSNSFTALIEDDASVWSDETAWLHAKKTLNVINESDSEEVDQTIKLEKPYRNDEAITEGGKHSH